MFVGGAVNGGLHVSKGYCQWRPLCQQKVLPIEAFMSAEGAANRGLYVSRRCCQWRPLCQQKVLPMEALMSIGG